MINQRNKIIFIIPCESSYLENDIPNKFRYIKQNK